MSPHAPRRTFIAAKGALVPLCIMLAFGCSRESASAAHGEAASALAWLLFAVVFVFVFIQMRVFQSRRIYDE